MQPHIDATSFGSITVDDEPQKPSLNAPEKVAKAYYAQVQKAAKEKAGRRDSRAIPKMATGVVVDHQGKGISGASILVKDYATDAVHGEGATGSTGRFQITLPAKSHKGLTLTVTKDGFTRWAQAGFYGGIVGYRVRLDKEIDDGFLRSLSNEKDQERRLWKLLEIVGDRQFSTEMSDLFPHIGMLREDLLHLVQSKAFETKDGKQLSPARRIGVPVRGGRVGWGGRGKCPRRRGVWR
jgi:hypothetical protein